MRIKVNEMKTLQARLFTYSILILVLFQLYGCTAVVEQKVVTPRTDGGSFSLILQPLPQEIDRLNFHIASVVARQESGRELHCRSCRTSSLQVRATDKFDWRSDLSHPVVTQV